MKPSLNRPTPSLDAVLSVMLIAMFTALFALVCAAAVLTGLAIGKFVVLPLVEMLMGFWA